MKRIIGNKTRFYNSLMTKSTGNSMDGLLDRSAELKKELVPLLPKGEDPWIQDNSEHESFFFKKKKRKDGKSPRMPHIPKARLPIQRDITTVNQKKVQGKPGSSQPRTLRKDNSVVLPKSEARPKSLPKVIISGGYSLSQQKLLEIRELFFAYSTGAETITLDCRPQLTQHSRTLCPTRNILRISCSVFSTRWTLKAKEKSLLILSSAPSFQ